MENNEKKPGINVWYLLVLVIFTLAGFFIGIYFAEKRAVEEREVPVVTKHLPAERHLDNLEMLTGWDNPEKELIDDLIEKTELIPHEPVLGGTMGFYDRDNIYLLNDQWVLASFEDGHIGGYMLLEFEIDEEQDIDWQVLSSYLE